MRPDVRLIHAEAIPVAVVRRVARPAELSRVVPQSCGVVWELVRSRGIRAGRNVAIYLDGAIHLEVGVELAGPFEAEGEVVGSVIPSGPVATAVHLGPYQRLGTAHQAIVEWCRSEGHRLTGPNWEIYGHWQSEWDSDPSAIRTDVFYQVAAAT